MRTHPCLLLLLLLLPLLALLPLSSSLGVTWGASSTHPLPPTNVVSSLLLPNRVTQVRLLDADPESLQALAGTGIAVVVGIPNAMLPGINASLKAARGWVHDNVTRYWGPNAGVRIQYIAVGDEPFRLSYGQQFQPFVVGAANNIQIALSKAKLGNKVKVVVPCSSDIFQSIPSLPSKGQFRPNLNKTMVELLSFLDKYDSPFVININPFQILQQNRNFSMAHALFQSTTRPITDGHHKYHNIFDASIDTLVVSLGKFKHDDMEIVVGKIGWPTDGAVNASASTAQIFIKGLVDHLQSKTGTPLRSKKFPMETYIFSLLDEDQRGIGNGSAYERHWGMYTFDGQAKYDVNLGQGSRTLVNAQNVNYLRSRWCVVDNNKDMSNASKAALDACSRADCSVLSRGGSCSEIPWPGNISYAFNSYYQQHDQRADSCDFSGLGLITIVDPSDNECRFPVQILTSDFVVLRRTSGVWWDLLVYASVLVLIHR